MTKELGLQMKFIIKNEQKTFSFDAPLSDSEDYGISAIPNWDTTVFLIDKSNKGFKLGFGTPCPDEIGYLEVTLYSSIKFDQIFPKNSGGPTFKEPKNKIPQDVRTL
jgi:hypothetical protein